MTTGLIVVKANDGWEKEEFQPASKAMSLVFNIYTFASSRNFQTNFSVTTLEIEYRRAVFSVCGTRSVERSLSSNSVKTWFETTPVRKIVAIDDVTTIDMS